MKEYDIYLFLGQSNMAGRGIVSERFKESYPEVPAGAGFEYRAVTDPGTLHHLTEPFGIEENNPDGINDRWGEVRAKSGGLVSSFANTYYQLTGIPVIGLSASKGGSRIAEWLPGTPYFKDMMNRIDSLLGFVKKEGLIIRHMNVLFCQGESDGDAGTDNWTESFHILESELLSKGFEKIFMIPIGKMNIEGKYNKYDSIREEQYELIRTDDKVVLASSLLEGMLERGLMKDEFHYFQKAYNEVGWDAAKHVVKHIYNK